MCDAAYERAQNQSRTRCPFAVWVSAQVRDTGVGGVPVSQDEGMERRQCTRLRDGQLTPIEVRDDIDGASRTAAGIRSAYVLGSAGWETLGRGRSRGSEAGCFKCG